MPPTDPKPETAGDAPLSLRRLTDAFAAMLGRKSPASGPPQQAAINTRSITEALLFVGRPDNEPLSAETLAATMRDITPEEVQQAVAQLQAEYDEDGSAMTIVESAAGYRMVLRSDLERVRDKFYGKIKQATLTPPALEVLAVIAYRQPVDQHTIDELRGQKSHSLASSLVRRGLVRIERSADDPRRAMYVTTERFLQVFGLSAADQLPQAAEFAAA